MMNAADSTVPSDTAQIVSRWISRGSLSQPNSHSPRNVDSRKNAARPSMASGAPKMLPTSREYAPQSMPNWNSCTSPVTTPIATLMTSSVPKNRVSRRYSSFLLRYHAVCSSAVRNASPIVIGTKKKWLIVTNANSTRARSTFVTGLPPVELAVQVDGGADQRQVTEGLREVAELAAGGVDLLGEQAQVVGVGEHLLEHQPGLLQPPGAGQGVDVPERAQREGTLVAAQAVGGGGGVVPVDQAVGDQLAVHRPQRGQPHRVAGGDEALQRHQQQRGIEHLGVVVLGERAHLGVPAFFHDLGVDRVAGGGPPGDVARPAAGSGHP